jgi:hypothetical protein
MIINLHKLSNQLLLAFVVSGLVGDFRAGVLCPLLPNSSLQGFRYSVICMRIKSAAASSLTVLGEQTKRKTHALVQIAHADEDSQHRAVDDRV